MLLHKAIAFVLNQHANTPMSADDIAAEITQRRLHRKDNGTYKHTRHQVVARMVHPRYSATFERVSPGRYRLKR